MQFDYNVMRTASTRYFPLALYIWNNQIPFCYLAISFYKNILVSNFELSHTKLPNIPVYEIHIV